MIVKIWGTKVLLDGLGVVLDRIHEKRPRLVDEVRQTPRARAQELEHAHQPRALLRRGHSGPHTGLAQQRLHVRRELVQGQPRDVLTVHPIEFFAVEHGISAADAFE